MSGNTIWGDWAQALAFSSVGATFLAVIAWSIPGPPIGPIAAAVALLLLAVASRLRVKVDPEGLTVPQRLRMMSIPISDIEAISVATDRQKWPNSKTSRMIVHLNDGSSRSLGVLASFDDLPWGRKSLEHVATRVARELGKPLH